MVHECEGVVGLRPAGHAAAARLALLVRHVVELARATRHYTLQLKTYVIVAY